MTVLTAANPIGDAIFALLQDATLQSALGGRLYDDIPEDTPRPCAFYEVFNETEIRGFGRGGMPEIELRTHVFSDVRSLSEAQAINLQIVALLKDNNTLVVDGYAQCGEVVYHSTSTLTDQELNGIKVHEVVSFFTIWLEQAA